MKSLDILVIKFKQLFLKYLDMSMIETLPKDMTAFEPENRLKNEDILHFLNNQDMHGYKFNEQEIDNNVNKDLYPYDYITQIFQLDRFQTFVIYALCVIEYEPYFKKVIDLISDGVHNHLWTPKLLVELFEVESGLMGSKKNYLYPESQLCHALLCLDKQSAFMPMKQTVTLN